MSTARHRRHLTRNWFRHRERKPTSRTTRLATVAVLVVGAAAVAVPALPGPVLRGRRTPPRAAHKPKALLGRQERVKSAFGVLRLALRRLGSAGGNYSSR